MTNEKNSVPLFRLEDLCSEIIDCPHSTPIWKEDGIRVIRNFNLIDGKLDFSKGFFVDEDTYLKRTRRAMPEPGDIIISREAPMGSVAIIPSNLKCCLGQRLVLLKVNRNRCTPEFLLFALMSGFVKEQLAQANKTGSTVSNLAIPDLKNIRVPVAKLHYEIGRLLSRIHDQISLNNQVNDNLVDSLEIVA